MTPGHEVAETPLYRVVDNGREREAIEAPRHRLDNSWGGGGENFATPRRGVQGLNMALREKAKTISRTRVDPSRTVQVCRGCGEDLDVGAPRLFGICPECVRRLTYDRTQVKRPLYGRDR